jgi:hypothetical protein
MRRVFRRAGAAPSRHLSLAELLAAAEAVARTDTEVA